MKKPSIFLAILCVSAVDVRAGYNPVRGIKDKVGQLYNAAANSQWERAGSNEWRMAGSENSAPSGPVQMQGGSKYDAYTSSNSTNAYGSSLAQSMSGDKPASSGFGGMDQTEYGDEIRLLSALGENPDDYVEILGTGSLGQWRKYHPAVLLDRFSNFASGNWKWTDLQGKNPGQIASEKKMRKEKVIASYKESFNDKAYEVIRKDIDVLQDKIVKSANKSLQKQLEFLLDSAMQAGNQLGKESFEVRFNEVYKGFRPSVTGESIADSLARAESSIRFAEDKDTHTLFVEVAKKLSDAQQELNMLKNRSGGSLDDALIAANNRIAHISSHTQKNQFDLYTDVIADLQKEEKAESVASDKLAEINARVMKLIENFVDTPADALEEAERQLMTFKDELKQLHNARGGKNMTKIKAMNEKIHDEEEVISQLKEKIRQVEADDRIIARRVDDLVAKHDNDLSAALEEIKEKNSKVRGIVNKIDKGIQAFLEKKIKEEEASRGKYDVMKREVDNFISTIYDAKIAIKNNPVAAFDQLDKDITAAELDLKRMKDKGSRLYATEIKEKQKQLELYKLALEQLKTEVKKFNDKVNEKLKLVLLKNNQDDKKALADLLSKVKSDSYMFYSTESEDSKITKITDPVEKEVALRLQRKIKSNVVSNPLNVAIEKVLKASSPVEYTIGFFAIINASLANIGLSPISPESLTPDKRMELSRALGEHQRALVAITQEPTSEVVKHEKKKAVIAKMLEDASRILAQDISGVSYEALKTGNAQVIGMDFAINKALNALVPQSTSLSSGMNDYSYADPKAEAYKTLELSEGASQSDVRAAYLRLARINHPDLGGDMVRFQEINNAYNLLNEGY